MISKYLRSDCCDAPVVQGYEMAPEMFPIWCTYCGTKLGVPGAEDVPDSIRWSYRTRHTRMTFWMSLRLALQTRTGVTQRKAAIIFKSLGT